MYIDDNTIFKQKDYALIAQFLNTCSFSAERVWRGKSIARKYKVFCDNNYYIFKIFREKPKLGDWYSLVAEYNDLHLLSAFKWIDSVDSNSCIISHWVNGVNLEDHLRSHTDEMMCIGKKACSLLKTLYSRTFSSEGLGIDYYSIQRNMLESMIKSKDRLQGFPHLDEYLNFLDSTMRYNKINDLYILHGDVRPENFIIKDDDLYLIDFENGGIGEYERDFPTLTTTIPKVFRPFAYGYISEFFNGEIPSKFWEKNLMYSVLHVIREAIWEADGGTNNNSADKSEIIYEQYDHLNTYIPEWFREF